MTFVRRGEIRRMERTERNCAYLAPRKNWRAASDFHSSSSMPHMERRED
jgi:hypothetical protein